MLRDHDIFAEQALARCSHTVIVGGVGIDMAKSCLCHCGEVHDADVIVFANDQVSQAIAFWKHHASITIAVQFILLPEWRQIWMRSIRPQL